MARYVLSRTQVLVKGERRWRWRLFVLGRLVATSTITYSSLAACDRALVRVRDILNDAKSLS